jgi:hypothetical protein
MRIRDRDEKQTQPWRLPGDDGQASAGRIHDASIVALNRELSFFGARKCGHWAAGGKVPAPRSGIYCSVRSGEC